MSGICEICQKANGEPFIYDGSPDTTYIHKNICDSCIILSYLREKIKKAINTPRELEEDDMIYLAIAKDPVSRRRVMRIFRL
jgi:hypothetical protein